MLSTEQEKKIRDRLPQDGNSAWFIHYEVIELFRLIDNERAETRLWQKTAQRYSEETNRWVMTCKDLINKNEALKEEVDRLRGNK